MVVLYATRHRLAVPALARWLLALGIVATLAANVAHGWPDGPVGAAVAAWPGLRAWSAATSSCSGSSGPPQPVRQPADQLRARKAEQPDHLVRELRLVPIPDTDVAEHDGALGNHVMAGEPDNTGENNAADVDAAAMAAYRSSVEIGSPLSERKLAAMFGKTSRRWARNRMAEASQALVPAVMDNPQAS